MAICCPPDEGCKTADVSEMCLVFLVRGMDLLQREEYASADRTLQAAQVVMRAMPPEKAPDGRALALYYMSLLRGRQGRDAEAREMREQATACLVSDPSWAQNLMFQHLMAEVLWILGEYRRAIPFFEQVVQLAVELDDRVSIADVLYHLGSCYTRIGLRDHAAVPLREALKFFRTQSGDPRLPSVLLNLGNALRKSSPAEAERYYQESADWHVSRAQLESAAPAWVNLGVLCSEQDRHAESLAHYEKALRVREQSPGTPPERLGTVINNMASNYRRMKQFEQAHQSVDRAIGLLEPKGGSALASAYGTRGLILSDEGRDEEAIEWFRRAIEEHEKQPSPNLEIVAEELEHEAEALKRLGRMEEASTAQERLASVRATIAGIRAADCDLSRFEGTTEGAVLITLNFGSRPGNVYGRSHSQKLADRLSEVIEGNTDGWFGGWATIPESTTLMFYGKDGEAVFRAIEPALASEPMCQGATVTVRQGEKQREVFLPGRVM
jgi:tetratricopeptide (TPR) repeat protein